MIKSKFPTFLHRKLPIQGQYFHTDHILKEYRLNTVCEEAKCPNRMECYAKGSATFLALGKECTRSCGFCDIDFHKTPALPEEDEPERIALSVQKLGLKHVVITMVARDDLQDGGAAALKAIIGRVKELNPHCSIEILTSDFAGNKESLALVLTEDVAIFNHNIETVRALTPKIRHKATYERSLSMLQYAKEQGKTYFVKSGIMVGLGETAAQIEETLTDLKTVGCDIVTIGHYLQADRHRLAVKEFVPPEQFADYEAFGKKIGIPFIYAAPFVRSSYNAADLYSHIQNHKPLSTV